MQTILDLSVRDNDIVLDFFSGSGTMGEAVMRWNAKTNNSIRYILVQIQEQTKDNSSAKKAGYSTIDEIGRDRIQRTASTLRQSSTCDVGFKHFTLKEPSDQTLAQLETFNPNVIFTDDNILNEFGRDSVLQTWVVRDGYGMNAQIMPIKLGKYVAYLCGRHLYFVNPYLNCEGDADPIVALINKYNNEKDFKPENIVLFGYSFTYTETESLKKNLLPLRDGIKNLRVNLDIRY